MSSLSPEKVCIHFILPFAIDVVDTVDLRRTDQGYVAVLDDRGYVVTIDGLPAVIKTRKLRDERAYMAGFSFGDRHIKLTHDRFGWVTRLFVQVWFGCDVWRAEGIPDGIIEMPLPQLVQTALRYFNAFLRCYREISGDFHVKTVDRKSIGAVGQMVGFRGEDGALTWKSNKSLITPETNAILASPNPITISQEQDDRLRTRLKTPAINLARELRLDIDDNFDRGEFSLALIQCATYFEAQSSFLLREKLSGEVVDELERLRFRDRLTTGIRDHLGIDFGGTHQYGRFIQKVWETRNDIVHGKRLGKIEEDECREAISATDDALEKLIGMIRP